MLDKFSINEAVFDRLVDGELSADERRRLLESLDHYPDGWRRCALSFVEAQSWKTELGQLVRESAKSVVDGAQPLRVGGENAGARHRIGRAGAWLAIAAGLFIAFTLGSLWPDGNSRLADGVVSHSGVQIADVVPPPAAALADAPPADDALMLWVRDAAGQTRPLRVPLVDAGTLERQLGLQFQSGVPAAVRSQLQNRGFDIQSKQRFAPLWLDDGRPMIVPVEDTKIVPVSRSVY